MAKGVYSMKAEAGRAEVLLYDAISPYYGISAKQFHADLKALGEVETIDLRINSPGGSITEGMAIHSILKRQTAKVIAHVDGIAASMASVIAMAASEVVMAEGSYLMIHNPLGAVMGEASEMRDYADLLDKMKGQLVNIYVQKSKQSAESVAALMDAETWFTAAEAIDAGFADRTSPELALAASLDAKLFNRVPNGLTNILKGEAQMSKETTNEPIAKTPEQIRAEMVAANKDYSDRFGADLAAKWGPLGESKPLLDCYVEFVEKLKSEHSAAIAAKDSAHATAIADLTAKVTDAEKKATDAETRLASLSLGENEGVSGGGANKDAGKKPLNVTPAAKAFADEFALPQSKK